MSKKILVISHDKVGPSMAGPGIRYHNIATVLSNVHSVTLGVFNPKYIEGLVDTSYEAQDIHVQHFKQVFDGFDTIIALWLSDEMIEYAKSKGIQLVFDLYAPVPVEDLMQRVFGGKTDQVSDYDYSQMLRNYSHFIKNGDFFLTSNPQQRDFWIGYAFASGAITPSSQNDRGIDTYFGICPMGIDDHELKTYDGTDLLSERLPDLKKTDFVITWTGGIWDWFDAQTPIRAMKQLHDAGRHDIKLVFLGTKHPNDDVPAMAETETARTLATELKLLNKSVYFLDGWLPYADRIGYLSRANAAVYAHRPSIEARFSHRTRVLDHILMSLPTIATEGDYFADMIGNLKLGITTPVFDDERFAEAITSLSDDAQFLSLAKKNITALRHEFFWKNTLKELAQFLDDTSLTNRGFASRIATSHSPAALIESHPLIRRLKRKVPTRIKSSIKKVIR